MKGNLTPKKVTSYRLSGPVTKLIRAAAAASDLSDAEVIGRCIVAQAKTVFAARYAELAQLSEIVSTPELTATFAAALQAQPPERRTSYDIPRQQAGHPSMNDAESAAVSSPAPAPSARPVVYSNPKRKTKP